MAWKLEGTYFENCNCDVVCPCTTSGLAAPGDADRCLVLLVFHVDSGEIEGVDVGGLSVGLFCDAPAKMDEGNWRAGVFMDERATPEQGEKLGTVFSGQLGGPFAAMGPLIGENLGVEAVAIEYADEGLRHRARLGDAVEVEVEDVVLTESGEPLRLSGAPFPAPVLTVGKGTTSRIQAFGYDVSNTGKNAFSAPFAWSA